MLSRKTRRLVTNVIAPVTVNGVRSTVHRSSPRIPRTGRRIELAKLARKARHKASNLGLEALPAEFYVAEEPLPELHRSLCQIRIIDEEDFEPGAVVQAGVHVPLASSRRRRGSLARSYCRRHPRLTIHGRRDKARDALIRDTRDDEIRMMFGKAEDGSVRARDLPTKGERRRCAREMRL